MATVDATVWLWGRLGMADDKPGVRLIAWNMLKASLEERAARGGLQNVNWRLILDSPEKLRFGEAGLTIQSDVLCLVNRRQVQDRPRYASHLGRKG